MLMKIMKTCVAAAVALGCVLVVPGASFAQDQDKSATASPDKSKAPATKQHKKPKKKGYADDVHDNPSYDNPRRLAH
jgi:hypothetical protein